MSSIKLNNLRVEDFDDRFVLICDVISDCFTDKLWLEVRGASSSSFYFDYSWALVAILMPAMLLKRSIVIDGEVSKFILSNARRDLQSVLRIYDPRLGKIGVSSNISDRSSFLRSTRTATGFSGGIDTFATLADYLPGQSEDIRISDLCTLNVGAIEGGQRAISTLFEKYRNRTEAFAAKFGLQSLSINSNISHFYSGFSFQGSHTLRNVAAVLALDGYLGCYLYSSGYSLNQIGVSPGGDTARLDPLILPMLSTETLRFVSGGAGYSRLEKTRIVSDFEYSWLALDVCISSANDRLSTQRPNCSRCWKCVRTLFSLYALGVLDRYREVFDVDFFNANKPQLLTLLANRASRGNGPDLELLEFMESRKMIIVKRP